ncbi:hypothetical protein HK096_007441 [Nowakowskiella sp. JEL0078]|nr:hypothetical protein HK096_007441 [Nowakowskiella sp. JEL0078]
MRRKWVSFEGIIECTRRDIGKASDCLCISLTELGMFREWLRLIILMFDFKDRGHSSMFTKSLFQTIQIMPSRSAVERRKIFLLVLLNPKSPQWSSFAARGHYPNIPVPKVYSYNLTYTNPAGAPYMIMDVVKGRVLGRKEFHKLTKDKQLQVVQKLPEIKASLTVPLSEFSQIGCITFENSLDLKEFDNNKGSAQSFENRKFIVGPLLSFQFSMEQGYVIERTGPHKSLYNLWSDLLLRVSQFALENFTELESDEIDFLLGDKGTPLLFKELSIRLASMVSRLSKNVPKEYTTLCLHHTDFALRNVLFDDLFNVCGVIDWALTAVMPIIVTADYPKDLHSTPYEPFRISENFEDWDLVSFDWTNMGDKKLYPTSIRISNDTKTPVPIDFNVEVSNEIAKFYLRAHFATCFLLNYHEETEMRALTEQQSEGYNLYLVAPKYLKLHEILMEGIPKWFKFSNWIKNSGNYL